MKDYSRCPNWTDEQARLAAVHVLVAWAKGETPCSRCGRTMESQAFGQPCPATVSGYHLLDEIDAEHVETRDEDRAEELAAEHPEGDGW